jgi:AcrR family transcriptional regulator
MPSVKRRYDNSRRQEQAHLTRRRIVDAAKQLFAERGYPATTLEAVAAAAGASAPTLYRLFSSKAALLKEVLDVSFGGDDRAIAFGDRPEVVRARNASDATEAISAFAAIGRAFMDRSSAILHVLATAAAVDADAARLLRDVREQRRTGQARIVAALARLKALDPALSKEEAVDLTYVAMSPEVHRILTVERGWTGEQYERYLARALASLLAPHKG